MKNTLYFLTPKYLMSFKPYCLAVSNKKTREKIIFPITNTWNTKKELFSFYYEFLIARTRFHAGRLLYTF